MVLQILYNIKVPEHLWCLNIQYRGKKKRKKKTNSTVWNHFSIFFFLYQQLGIKHRAHTKLEETRTLFSLEEKVAGKEKKKRGKVPQVKFSYIFPEHSMDPRDSFNLHNLIVTEECSHLHMSSVSDSASLCGPSLKRPTATKDYTVRFCLAAICSRRVGTDIFFELWKFRYIWT